MRRKITIRILNRQFPVAAESPEKERQIREAAEKVDEKYYEYMKLFPDRSTDEILSFVALNGFIEAAELQEAEKRRLAEEEMLEAELKSYLENSDKI